jgi:oxygen-independent coproporphyrinogen-3 oxidase
MIEAIIKEIGITSAYPDNEIIETVYFGGGTPSLLTGFELQMIMDALQKKFNIVSSAEITLEANPDDITKEKLEEWKTAGVNRLSIGIQTFDEAELKWMNRAHSASQSVECIQLARKAGFDNFSVDLIYGSPMLDDEQLKKNIGIVVENNIPHVSAYALTVEPKTALDKMIETKRSLPVDAEKQAHQFLLLVDMLEAAGYEHYEISNFAKPDMRSRHNSSYWQNSSYYGFGPAAHSYNGTSRKWNIANNALYIQSLLNNKVPYEEEILTPSQQLNEFIMTSLRTMEGLDLNLVSEKFGNDKRSHLEMAAEKWKDKLSNKNGHLILNREGKLFADGIAADLFE